MAEDPQSDLAGSARQNGLIHREGTEMQLLEAEMPTEGVIADSEQVNVTPTAESRAPTAQVINPKFAAGFWSCLFCGKYVRGGVRVGWRCESGLSCWCGVLVWRRSSFGSRRGL